MWLNCNNTCGELMCIADLGIAVKDLMSQIPWECKSSLVSVQMMALWQLAGVTTTDLND